MSQKHESKPARSTEIHGDIFDGLEHSVDLHSSTISADEAPFVRQALVRAQALRLLETNPGDAYLQGITDALGFKHLQEQVEALNDDTGIPQQRTSTE